MDRTLLRNIHGKNITKVRVCRLCAKCVQNVYKLCAYYVQTVCKLCANCAQTVWLALVLISYRLTFKRWNVKFSFGDRQTDTHTSFCPSRAASLQLKKNTTWYDLANLKNFLPDIMLTLSSYCSPLCPDCSNQDMIITHLDVQTEI